jgi:hypothetical protein
MEWNATFNTPYISLNPYNLSIRGNSFMDDPFSFYQPLIKKLMYFQNDTLFIELDLGLLNINSKKQIFRVLTLTKENPHIKYLKIFWLHDPSNEYSCNLSKEFENNTGVTFEYFDYA